MKILVTGGAGFIGNNFIRFWLQKYPKDKIINFDKLTYAGHLTSTKDFSDNKNYSFMKGDITNVRAVNLVMRNVDLVVHFAAESHVDRSVTGPGVFIKTNVLGTQILLEAALKNKIKRFHHVSTDEVFGALSLENKKKFDEETKYDPHSPYSASKASSDHLVRAYGDTFDLPFTITNCANNFGPFHDPEKLFPRLITNLIDRVPIPIYGDGKYVRDWLFVEDHCRAIEMVIKKGKEKETYLVGSGGREINNLEIAKKLLNIFDLDSSYINFVEDRPGHDRRYAINPQKIMKLGWKPKQDFDSWLNTTIKWYQDNQWWWRPLKRKSEQFYETPRANVRGFFSARINSKN